MTTPAATEHTFGTQASSTARLRVAIPAVASRVAAEIRLQLAEGALTPGMRLTEATIAEELGVSRNTVREAFAELSGERLVVRLPNRGVFVATLGAEDLHDVYAARQLLEVGAARAGGSPEQVAAVRKAVEEGKLALRDGDNDRLGSANQHFHRALVEMAGSERLNALMSQILAEMRLFFHQANIIGGFYEPYLQENERITEALEAGDFNRAADMLSDYLRRSEEHQKSIHGG